MLAVIGFLLNRQVSNFLGSFGYELNGVPRVWFLRDQYEFFEASLPGQLVIQDLYVFELFVWLALLIAAMRVSIGVFDLGALEAVSIGLSKLGISLFKYFTTLFLLGPFAILVSVNIGWTSRVSQLAYIMQHSIRAFLSIEAFVFCGGVFFLTEGLMFLLWLLFTSKRASSSSKIPE